MEYEAGNFLYHGHDKELSKLPQSGDCIVACWTDKGSGPIRKMGIEVISLKNVLNIELAKPPAVGNWAKGHMIFTNFRVFDPYVSFEILGRNMSHGGSLNLTFEEYQKIKGKI